MAQDGYQSIVKKLGFLSDIIISTDLPENGSSILSDNEKYFLQYEIEIDIEAEKERIQGDLTYAKGFVASVEKKLSNEKFVNGAPEMVVNKERQKLADGLERVKILEESLAKLG